MANKKQEFEISMVVFHPDNKYIADQIQDMFIEWVESKGMYCGGSIKILTNDEDEK